MKAINLVLAGIVSLMLIFSCSADKQAELTKLKQQQTELSDKIKMVENEINATAKEGPNPNDFKVIAVTEVKYAPFDHYIRVQGKLDGDHNAAVFAESPGTISAKYADVGQHVTKGQVLAQIDDKQYQEPA